MCTSIKQNLLIAVGTSLMLLTGHAYADPSATEKIEAKLEQYESRFNRGNAEAVANLFSEDVVYYDPTGQVHHGREAVRRLYQGNLAAGFRDMDVEVIEIHVIEDTAYDIARYTITDPGGNRLTGYHLAFLVKEEGEWAVERTLVNAVMPKPPTE